MAANGEGRARSREVGSGWYQPPVGPHRREGSKKKVKGDQSSAAVWNEPVDSQAADEQI